MQGKVNYESVTQDVMKLVTGKMIDFHQEQVLYPQKGVSGTHSFKLIHIHSPHGRPKYGPIRPTT